MDIKREEREKRVCEREEGEREREKREREKLDQEQVYIPFRACACMKRCKNSIYYCKGWTGCKSLLSRTQSKSLSNPYLAG